ncbi:hypothetical protein Lbir_2510 [Legionella birminghamensis]|uniref:Uncharacterized protein n=1 Tax=Legionella birminghamensis TaxID=28083 RepID=A0A378I8L9_9GAMM|nr:hypothetical protein [Legionella birminghamensis]KTC67908.1 hypothetical protein Lbir_2510 [Legionella birminghamensis]STX31383.1 Uncharacterised protein [Legionella birminghamensis]
MGLRNEHDDGHSFNDYEYTHEDEEQLSHKKRIRKLLEDRLEKKRLREEIDELDGDFDWDELDK